MRGHDAWPYRRRAAAAASALKSRDRSLDQPRSAQQAGMAQAAEKPAWAGGTVLFAGGTDWAQLGRSSSKIGKPGPKAELERQQKYPNLPAPNRLKSLLDVKVAFVAAGSAAVHCIVGDVNGVCYTWGRNEKGQLGHGDLLQRNVPTAVAGLSEMKVVGGCGGRHHTVVFTEAGDSYTWGCNTQGQCGIGTLRKNKGKQDDLQLSPAKALVSGVTGASAGLDFTVWLCGGRVWSCGYPQYGQLGDGSDHMYNSSDSSIKIVYEPQPTPRMVRDLEPFNVVKVSCGHNHTIAVDDKGAAFTWGNGNYGKLGHKVQQDEMRPRPIESFKGRLLALPEGVIAAGSVSTLCTATGNQLYAWGKLKVSGDNTTHPAPVYDLQGWNLHSLSCGPQTFAVAADRSVITWGHAQNGELGYGPTGKKSSANPAKCDALEDMHTHQVAAGTGFTLFLVEPGPRLEQMPVFEPAVAVEEAAAGADEEGPGGAGAAAGGKGTKRKAPAAGGRSKK